MNVENSNEETIEFFSYICGKLLGDGCITYQPGRKSRFQFIHTSSDFEWCNYCYQQLPLHIPLNPPVFNIIKDKRISTGFTERYIVQSKTDEMIPYSESIWYKNRKKTIPFDYLEKYLNEKALAWWYLDDGHLKMDNAIPRKVILSTDNFTLTENLQLIKLLGQKYSIFFTLDGQNRLVIYDQLQIYYFYRLIQPFIHPSMKRKMIKPTQSTNKTIHKRTTIYLPDDIALVKPTSEMNIYLDLLPKLQQIVSDHESYVYYYQRYFIYLKEKQATKPYQINIVQKHWHLINKIKTLTGLTNSQIATICIWIEKYDV